MDDNNRDILHTETLIRLFFDSSIGRSRQRVELTEIFKCWIANHPDQEHVKEVLGKLWDESRISGDSLTMQQKREILDRMGITDDVVSPAKRRSAAPQQAL